MAVKFVNLGSGGTQDALLRQLAEQYSAQSKPEVGALGRILSPVVSIGSILDAYYDARFQDKNKKILNVLKNYGLNLGQGFATLATGKNYEQDEKMQQMSDILDRTNPSFKRTGLGKSAIGRIGIDIVSGLLTDPLTYISFGATTLADDVLKGGLKAAVKTSKLNIADDVVEGVATKISGSTLDNAALQISKDLGADVADNFYINMLKTAGKSGKNLKSGAMKVLGKTVTENKTLVQGAKAFANPLGLLGEGVAKGAKKVAPEAYFSVKNIFDPVGSAVESGRGDIADLIMKFQRAEGGSMRKADLALQEAGLYKAYEKLTPKQRQNLGKIIEAARRKSPETDALETIGKQRDSVESLLRRFISENTGQVSEKEFLTKLGEIYPDFDDVDTELQKALATTLGVQDKTVFDILTDKVSSFSKSGKTDDKAIGSAVDDIMDALGKKTLRQARDKTQVLKDLGQEELFTEIVTPGKKQPAAVQEFLDKYFGMQRGRAQQLSQQGFDTISEFDMGYIARGENVKGYKKDFINDVLRDRVDSKTIKDILNNGKVKAELKDGFVTRETLEKLLVGKNKGILSSYDAGELRTLLSAGGATKDRVFQTIRQAEGAGIVYDKDWMKSLLGQTVRQDEQLRAKGFVDELVEATDDTGEKLFRSDPQGIFRERVLIPGTKAGDKGTVLYTDRVTKKIAEDMIDKFSKTDDVEQLLTSFDKIMMKWKGWVTAKGPRLVPYHIRNAFDDTVRMVVGGANVATLPDDFAIGWEITQFNDKVGEFGVEEAAKQVDTSKIKSLYKTLNITPKEGMSEIEDLWRKLIDNGVYSDIAKMQSESGIPMRVTKLAGQKVSADDLYNEALTGKGLLTNREQMSRIAQFTNTFRKTGSVSAGVDDVRRVLFNYDELSKAEKQIAKRLVPFYAFTKNNIRFYLETLKNNPERLSRFSNVLDAIESGSQGAVGEDWDAMPDWMKEDFAIPINKKDGELRVLGNIGLSIENLNDLTPGKFISGNANPFLKMLIERVSGKNLYYDENILDVNSGTKYENYPQWFKDLVGYREYQGKSQGGGEYTKKTMSPEMKYWLENIPGLPQLMSPVTDWANIAGDIKSAPRQLTESLLPVTIYRQNIESGKYSKEKKQYEELYKLLQRKGLADSFTNFYIPEGLREQLLK